MEIGSKSFSEFQATAKVILDQIFEYLPECPERFSEEVQTQLVLKAISQCTFALQIITGVSMSTASEIAHTTYESISIKGQEPDEEAPF